MRCESHRRAIAAIDSGRFAAEIVPVPVPQKKGDPILVTTDERPRRDTTLESLARLRPAFRKDGTVTAGNSSGLNDGAAALLLMSAERAAQLGLKPLARIVTSAAAGVEPRIMGLGPVPAVRKVLQRAGLSVEDLGLVELNEAFAVQSLAVMRELGISESIANVNGGAIALGHPLGCSGARILTTLLHEMAQTRPAGSPTVLRSGDPVRRRRPGRSHDHRVAGVGRKPPGHIDHRKKRLGEEKLV